MISTQIHGRAAARRGTVQWLLWKVPAAALVAQPHGLSTGKMAQRCRPLTLFRLHVNILENGVYRIPGMCTAG